jgi:hypothetical protein
LPSAPAITLGNSVKNFPSSGVPNFVECSWTGLSAKNFLKKIKSLLCRRPLLGTLGTGFSKKNRKTTFADRLCQGLSAQVFQKQIKPPFLLTARARGRRQKRFQKLSTEPAVNGYFFWLTAHCGLSAQPVPRASSLGARQRAVAEKNSPSALCRAQPLAKPLPTV